MQPLSDHDLATALRELRPVPDAEFASRLDSGVASGFARRGRPSPLHRLASRLTRRRLLTASAAGAVAAVAIVTVVVAIAGSGRSSLHLNVDTERSGSPAGAGRQADAPPLSTVPSSASRGAESEGGSAAGSAASAGGVATSPTVHSPSSGPYASQARHRDIERAASIVLQTDPDEVREASAKVFEAVHTVNGIVLGSSSRDGAGDGSASFDLLIPSSRLGDALASFSSIAEVASRHESTTDVTARTVGLDERLQDAQVTVRSLLAQLAAADTAAERARAEAELRAERHHAVALRAQLTTLERRTHFSRVSLRIVSGDTGGAVGTGGSWGVGSALADAGRILEIAAGVILIGLAVLTPIALIVFLAWLGHRRWLEAGRRRALG